MITAAKERCAGTANITFLHADAQAIPLADDAVDLVFGTWAIGAILPPEARERAMGEIHRVVRAGGEIWAVENHWDSEFMAMRGPEEQEGDHQTWRWYESHGFTLVDAIETAFLPIATRSRTRTRLHLWREGAAVSVAAPQPTAGPPRNPPPQGGRRGMTSRDIVPHAGPRTSPRR
jgi:SAM-dependent methyltransferase